MNEQQGTGVATVSDSKGSARAPHGTVTFLFTDVEGSTALVRRLRNEYGTLLATHHRLLRDAFSERGGHEVDTQGDAFFVAFPRARDALEAAAAAQRAVAREPWPAEATVRVRMGIHTAEPGLAENGYHGLGVVRGARICSAGHGGQILLSAATRALVDEEELEGLAFRDLGAHRLKGLDQPERLFQLVVDGLPERFPPLRTAAVVRNVAGREIELAAAAQAAIEGAGPKEGLEFRILGPLEALKDGRPLELGGQKQRALLALLLLEAGRVVPTERLIDTLWGEHPPRTAATSLQNFISQLRKLLGAGTIQTKAPGYVLRLEPGRLDLQRFTMLVEEAREAPDPAARSVLLREALGIWRDAPLADFVYEAFAQGEIGRLEELRLVALEQRIDADLELERHAEVVGELETLVRQYPLRERLRGQLMLALYRSGRQADALQAYQDARRAMVGELGIEPSPALQDLHASILRQDLRLASASSQRPSGEDHVRDVARELLAGRLIPVIGDDVSALTEQLVRQFEVPDASPHLPHVSQYVAVMRGAGPLYDALHDEFAQPGTPTASHRFFASLPPILRAQGVACPLLVTTSYGLGLEQAFVDAGEEFDVVAYIADGRDRGRFCHVMSTGDAQVIHEPNTYAQLSLEQRTVILRLHGHVDPRPERMFESFVVTEDDYIHYLGSGELTSVVPVSLVAKLRRSHFLFLGYVLRDWNLRVVLHRLWGDQRVNYRSWAVHEEPVPLEEAFWRQRDVVVVRRSADEYVEALAGAIDALRPLEEVDS